jgi:hypothetical protein
VFIYYYCADTSPIKLLKRQYIKLKKTHYIELHKRILTEKVKKEKNKSLHITKAVAVINIVKLMI